MKAGFPQRGADPQFDQVYDIIQRVSMKDPDTVLQMLLCTLRFLRDKGIAPGIVISFNEMAESGPDGAAGVSGLTFAINPDKRYVVMLVDDAATRAAVVGRVQERMHEGASLEVVDFLDEKKPPS